MPAKARSPRPKTSNLQQLHQQINQLTEALQRERADAHNVRRRADEEKEKLASFYKIHIMRELLPAIDNLERALKHSPKELADNSYVKGVKAVAKEFDSALDKLGISRIKTVGEKFDPHVHDAIGIEDGEGKVEVVCEELQPGYLLDGEIIRPALVKVKKT